MTFLAHCSSYHSVLKSFFLEAITPLRLQFDFWSDLFHVYQILHLTLNENRVLNCSIILFADLIRSLLHLLRRFRSIQKGTALSKFVRLIIGQSNLLATRSFCHVTCVFSSAVVCDLTHRSLDDFCAPLNSLTYFHHHHTVVPDPRRDPPAPRPNQRQHTSQQPLSRIRRSQWFQKKYANPFPSLWSPPTTRSADWDLLLFNFPVNQARSWEWSSTSLPQPLFGTGADYLFIAPDFIFWLQFHIGPAYAFVQPVFVSARAIATQTYESLLRGPLIPSPRAIPISLPAPPTHFEHASHVDKPAFPYYHTRST